MLDAITSWMVSRFLMSSLIFSSMSCSSRSRIKLRREIAIIDERVSSSSDSPVAKAEAEQDAVSVWMVCRDVCRWKEERGATTVAAAFGGDVGDEAAEGAAAGDPCTGLGGGGGGGGGGCSPLDCAECVGAGRDGAGGKLPLPLPLLPLLLAAGEGGAWREGAAGKDPLPGGDRFGGGGGGGGGGKDPLVDAGGVVDAAPAGAVFTEEGRGGGRTRGAAAFSWKTLEDEEGEATAGSLVSVAADTMLMDPVTRTTLLEAGSWNCGAVPVVTVSAEVGSATNSTTGESGGVHRPATEGVRGVLFIGEGGAGGGGGDSGSSEDDDDARERRAAGVDDEEEEEEGCAVKMGGGGVNSRAAARGDVTAAGGGGGGGGSVLGGGGGGGGAKTRKCTGRAAAPAPDSDDCDPAADRVGGEEGAEGTADPVPFAGVDGAEGTGDSELDSESGEADRGRYGRSMLTDCCCCCCGCDAMIGGGGGGGDPVSNDPVLVALSLRSCWLMTGLGGGSERARQCPASASERRQMEGWTKQKPGVGSGQNTKGAQWEQQRHKHQTRRPRTSEQSSPVVPIGNSGGTVFGGLCSEHRRAQRSMTLLPVCRGALVVLAGADLTTNATAFDRCFAVH